MQKYGRFTKGSVENDIKKDSLLHPGTFELISIFTWNVYYIL